MQAMHPDSGGLTSVPAEVLHRALGNVTHAVVITDSHGGVLFWNSSAAALWGYSAQEALGRDVDTLILPAGRQGARRALEGVAPGLPFVGSWLMRDRADRAFPTWASISAFAGEDGEVTHYISVWVDLSGEHAAGQNMGILASIGAASSDAMLAVDREGTVVWANHATEEVLGWPAADFIGEPVSVLVPEEMRDDQELRRRLVIEGTRPEPYVTAAIKRDGTAFDASVTVEPWRDPAGDIVGFTCLFRDVTETRTTELERATELDRARFEQVSMPQALVDLEARFLSVNDALCELVGYPRADLLGRRISDLIHPMDTHDTETHLAGLLDGTADSGSYETIGRHANGRALPALLDVTVLRDTAGSRYAMAVFVQDLSEIREAQKRLATQEALFRALSRRSSDASLVTDAEFNIMYVSPSVAELLGYEPEEVLMLLGWDFVHPDDRAAVEPLVAAVVAEPDRTERFTLRIKDASGEWRWAEETLTNCLADPDIGGMVVNLRDITERVEAERSLRESEARYRAIVTTAQEGILAIGPDGRTVLANDKLAEIVGRSLEDIYRFGILNIVPSDLAAQLAEPLSTRHLVGPEKYEILYHHPDGTERILSVSSSPLSTDEDGLLGAFTTVSDVTEARRIEDRLRWQAMHDPLTKLPNRDLFIDRLEMAAARQRRDERRGVAVLFLDLDQFKLVNDSRGHETGDRLLKEVAARLQSAVRQTDTVARLGGDEFAVVCEDADEQAALQVASRIQAVLSEPVDLDGELLYVSASIGVALSPPHSTSSLLRFADVAMYKAKNSGSSGVVVFESPLASGAEQGPGVKVVLPGADDLGAQELHPNSTR